MSAIKRMNWFRKPTALEQNAAWREKRAAARQKFEETNAAFVNGLGAAWSNEISGSGNISLQMAADRIKAASAAKQAQLQKTLNQFA